MYICIYKTEIASYSNDLYVRDQISKFSVNLLNFILFDKKQTNKKIKKQNKEFTYLFSMSRVHSGHE